MTGLAARSWPEFRERPEGGYVAGESWLYFALPSSIFGYVLWGAPGADELRGLTRVLEAELDRPPHPGLVDVSRVEAFGAPAFEVLAAFVTTNAAALSRVVERTVLVPPRGLNGAIAGGFFAAVPPPFPVSYAERVADALERLGHFDPAAGARAIDEAQVEASGVPGLMRALRVHLEHRPVDPSLDDAARALGVSTRTLQRRLAGLGTTFVDEVQDARVRLAVRLIRETAEPLTAIALTVGCASPQHFSALFRKRTGLSPSEFRARPARPPPDPGKA